MTSGWIGTNSGLVWREQEMYLLERTQAFDRSTNGAVCWTHVARITAGRRPDAFVGPARKSNLIVGEGSI
jgi:hypothetical protein